MGIFKKNISRSNLDPVLDLVEWWEKTFTTVERNYMATRFKPMGGNPNHPITEYLRSASKPDAYIFLSGLMSWCRDKEHVSISDRIHVKIVEISHSYPLRGPGFLEGRKSTTYWPDIQELKKSGLENELETLLKKLIEVDKAEAKTEGVGVIPGFYNELAILYRKRKEFAKEVQVLEDFSVQNHANGVMPGQLLERLQKAKKLLEKQQTTTETTK